MTRSSLTVATYNIHGGRGLDGRYDPERVARVIMALEADIVALQEVRVEPGAGSSQLDILADRTGMTSAFGPAINESHRAYGNAILVRGAIEAVRHENLALPKREPRAAMDAVVKIDGASLRVVNTHFGLRAWERREQARRILALIDTGPELPGALTGDFNWWHRWGRGLHRLMDRLGRPPSPATFPSRWPLLSLDRIWSLGHAEVMEAERHVSQLSRVASDHLPLVARLSVPSSDS